MYGLVWRCSIWLDAHILVQIFEWRCATRRHHHPEDRSESIYQPICDVSPIEYTILHLRDPGTRFSNTVELKVWLVEKEVEGGPFPDHSKVVCLLGHRAVHQFLRPSNTISITLHKHCACSMDCLFVFYWLQTSEEAVMMTMMMMMMR